MGQAGVDMTGAATAAASTGVEDAGAGAGIFMEGPYATNANSAHNIAQEQAFHEAHAAAQTAAPATAQKTQAVGSSGGARPNFRCTIQ